MITGTVVVVVLWVIVEVCGDDFESVTTEATLLIDDVFHSN